MQNTTQTNDSPELGNTGATDVQTFIADLDGGMFERKLALALSQTAAAVTDHEKAGEVVLKFSIRNISGTGQVHIDHCLKYTRPTLDGKSSEEESRTTSMHVGKYGRLSLVPENQLKLFGRNGEIAIGQKN